MRSEENSKLISDLYNAKSLDEVYDALEYMGEVGDPIFTYPMLDGYRKFKYSSVGYYFIWCLSRLDYANLGKRLNELLENYDIQKEHIPMALFFMAERGYFSEFGNSIAAMYVDYCLDPEFRADFSLDGLGLGCVLDYLHKAGGIAACQDKLREAFFDEYTNQNAKAMVLSYLLETNQEDQVDFLIENYFDRIRNTQLERSVAKKLVFCEADNAKKLKKLIMENGGNESVDVLARLGKKIGSRHSDAARHAVYSNTDAVIKIGILRMQINRKTLNSEEFGFKVFPESWLVAHQFQSVDNSEIFFELCADLLAIIRGVDAAVRNHGLSRKEALEIWMNIPERKEEMGLPQLLLFLNSRKVGVDYNFYGFRELDRALEAIVEHREDDEFYKKMRKLGVEQMYREKKWHNIHSFFLNYYMQVLENMNKGLNHLTSKN